MASRTARSRRKAACQAELELLRDLANGKKTYQDVKTEAMRFRFSVPQMENLIHTNAARGIQGRLKELTGISDHSLNHFRVRCKADEGNPTTTGGSKLHPFSLLSTKIQRLLFFYPQIE